MKSTIIKIITYLVLFIICFALTMYIDWLLWNTFKHYLLSIISLILPLAITIIYFYNIIATLRANKQYFYKKINDKSENENKDDNDIKESEPVNTEENENENDDSFEEEVADYTQGILISSHDHIVKNRVVGKKKNIETISFEITRNDEDIENIEEKPEKLLEINTDLITDNTIIEDSIPIADTTQQNIEADKDIEQDTSESHLDEISKLKSDLEKLQENFIELMVSSTEEISNQIIFSESILNASPIGILVSDNNDKIIMNNNILTSILNMLSKENLLRTNSISDELYEIIGKGVQQNQVVAIESGTKETYYFLRTVGLLQNEESSTVGFVHSLHDITEREKLSIRVKAQTQELKAIMHTISQGILTIDTEYKLTQYYSHFTEEILNRTNLGGEKFFELFKINENEKLKSDLERLFYTLFNQILTPLELINDINPLKQYCFSQVDAQGEIISNRYYNFQFERIFDKNNTVKNVLIVITDVTSEVELKQFLEQQEKRKNDQLELLNHLLRADMNTVMTCVTDAVEIIELIKKLSLKLPNLLPNEWSSLKLETHTLKGLFNLIFSDKENVLMIHELEDLFLHLESTKEEKHKSTVNKIIEKIETAINDVQVIINKIGGVGVGTNKEKIRNIIERTKNIITKYNQLNVKIPEDIINLLGNILSLPKINLEDFFKSDYILNLVLNNAEQLNKNVNLITELEVKDIDADIFRKLKDPIIHLLLNAIDHGVEARNERIELGKPELANIKIITKINNGMLQMIILDDGKGIEWSKIKTKLYEKGYLKEEEVDSIDDTRLYKFLFSSGFSSKEKSTYISGRGIGLDIVKQNIFRLGGKIGVYSKYGKGTGFIIIIPMN